MDERTFEQLAHKAFGAVDDLFEDVDPDVADVEFTGDVIRIEFAGGKVVVLNTQRPARQLWLAGGVRAWHFNYAEGRWVDDKEPSRELFATLAELAREHGNVELPSAPV